MGRAKGRSLGWQGRGMGIRGGARWRVGTEAGRSLADWVGLTLELGEAEGRAGRDSEEGGEEGPAPSRPGGDASAGRPRGLSRAPTASFRGPRVLLGT